MVARAVRGTRTLFIYQKRGTWTWHQLLCLTVCIDIQNLLKNPSTHVNFIPRLIETGPVLRLSSHPIRPLLLPANLGQSSLLLTNQQQGRTKDARKGRRGTKEWGEGGRRKMPKPILLEEVQVVHIASLFMVKPNFASHNDHIYFTFLTWTPCCLCCPLN